MDHQLKVFAWHDWRAMHQCRMTRAVFSSPAVLHFLDDVLDFVCGMTGEGVGGNQGRMQW